jgi:hypothetical protein
MQVHDEYSLKPSDTAIARNTPKTVSHASRPPSGRASSECVSRLRSVFSEVLDRKGIAVLILRQGHKLIRMTLEDPDNEIEVEVYAYNTAYKYAWS